MIIHHVRRLLKLVKSDCMVSAILSSIFKLATTVMILIVVRLLLVMVVVIRGVVAVVLLLMCLIVEFLLHVM